MTEIYAHKGRARLRLRALTLGHDIVILLDGGDTPHIGATALAGPGYTARSLCLPHHREDDLARRVANTLTQRLGRAVSVVCGIHVDAITKEEIADVYALADTLITEFLKEKI